MLVTLEPLTRDRKSGEIRYGREAAQPLTSLAMPESLAMLLSAKVWVCLTVVNRLKCQVRDKEVFCKFFSYSFYVSAWCKLGLT
jgi:hypothetical protein